MTIEIAFIGLTQAIMVAVIGGLFAQDSKKRKQQLESAEARAAIRAEESRLSMKMMSADVNLSVATARAVKEGKTNEEMDAALTSTEEALQEYYNFINTVAAKQITKP